MPKVKENIIENESGGSKGVKLADFSKIPPDALWALAERYGLGSAKYDNIERDGTGPRGSNWEKGLPFSQMYQAFQRHANAAWGGEDIDEAVLDGIGEELGIEIGDLNGAELHWAAVAFYAIGFLHIQMNYDHYQQFDDRSLISGFLND